MGEGEGRGEETNKQTGGSHFQVNPGFDLPLLPYSTVRVQQNILE